MNCKTWIILVIASLPFIWKAAVDLIHGMYLQKQKRKHKQKHQKGQSQGSQCPEF